MVDDRKKIQYCLYRLTRRVRMWYKQQDTNRLSPKRCNILDNGKVQIIDFKLPVYNTPLSGVFKIDIPSNWSKYLNRIYQEMGTKMGVTISIDAFAGEAELKYEIFRNNDLELIDNLIIQLCETYDSDRFDRICRGEEYKFPPPIMRDTIYPGYKVLNQHWYEDIAGKSKTRNKNA